MRGRGLGRCANGCSSFRIRHSRGLILRRTGCRGRRGGVSRVRSCVSHFHCGTSGTHRTRDHVGTLRGVRGILPTRLSGPFDFGFERPSTLPGPVLVVSRIDTNCRGGAVLRRVHLGLIPNDHVNLLNQGNTNGSALVGLLSNRLTPRDNVFDCSRNMGVNCFTRRRLRALRVRRAPLRRLVRVTPGRARRRLHSCLNDFNFRNRGTLSGMNPFSNNRGTHLMLTLII